VLRNAVRDSDDGIVRKISDKKMRTIKDSIESKVEFVNTSAKAVESVDMQLKMIRYNEKKFRYLHNLDCVNAEKYATKVMWIKNDIFDIIREGEYEMRVVVSSYNKNGERNEDYVGPCNDESVRQFAKSMMSCKKTDEELIKVAKQYL